MFSVHIGIMQEKGHPPHTCDWILDILKPHPLPLPLLISTSHLLNWCLWLIFPYPNINQDCRLFWEKVLGVINVDLIWPSLLMEVSFHTTIKEEDNGNDDSVEEED